MRKFLPVLLLVLMIGGSVGIYVAQNWDPYRDVPQVSLDRLNNQEADWYAEGIWDYRLLVLVRFGLEQRRYEIEVRDNLLANAQSSLWDEADENWESFILVPEEEAAYFTVPGMFNLLRTDLLNEDVERVVLRMELAPGHAHPGLIYLGDIIQEGFPVEDTHLIIEVLEFEELEK